MADLKWKRDEPGNYTTDCGRFTALRAGKSGGWGAWELWDNQKTREIAESDGPIRLACNPRRSLADCKTLATQQLADEKRAAEYLAEREAEIERVRQSETCPEGVGWLDWHNLRHGGTITRDELREQTQRAGEAVARERAAERMGFASFTDCIVRHIETQPDTLEAIEAEPISDNATAWKCGAVGVLLEHRGGRLRWVVTYNGYADWGYWSAGDLGGVKLSSEDAILAAESLREWLRDTTEDHRVLSEALAARSEGDGFALLLACREGVEPVACSVAGGEFPALNRAIRRAGCEQWGSDLLAVG